MEESGAGQAAAAAIQTEEDICMALEQSVYDAFAGNNTVPELADKPKQNEAMVE